MRIRPFLLLLASGGLASPGWAQRAAVAPLAPINSVGRPVAPTRQTPVLTTQVVSAAPATTTAASANQLASPGPACIINARYLGTLGLLNPQDIADLQVYKTAAPYQWRGLVSRGIVSITLKPTAHMQPTKSLAALRRGLHVRGPVEFTLEGLAITDPSLRVARRAIARLEVLPLAGKTVVNIHLVRPAPVVHPPGTIMIRGVASQ